MIYYMYVRISTSYIMYFADLESPLSLTPAESEISDEDVNLELGLNPSTRNANTGRFLNIVIHSILNVT